MGVSFLLVHPEEYVHCEIVSITKFISCRQIYLAVCLLFYYIKTTNTYAIRHES